MCYDRMSKELAGFYDERPDLWNEVETSAATYDEDAKPSYGYMMPLFHLAYALGVKHALDGRIRIALLELEATDA